MCVCELVACLPQLPHPLLLLAHPTPSSGACCLHLCGNPTMSTMQHKSDNAVVVLSDSGGKSCAAGSPPFAAPASAPPALSCCVVPHKNSSFLAFSLCYATSHSSTSTPPLPPCSTIHLLLVAFLCPQFALAALSTSFALLLFLHCEEVENAEKKD